MKPFCRMFSQFAAAASGCVLLALTMAAQEPAPPVPEPPAGSNVSESTTPAAEDAEPKPGSHEDSSASPSPARRHREAVVVFGKDAELKAGDSAQAVVVIGGSATIAGKVEDAVVAIGGDVTIKDGAEVSETVAVLGNIKAEKGAKIRGEAVAVGGKVDAEEGSTITGHIQDIDFGGFVLPKMEWLRSYFKHCVLMLRPLAPQVGWVWLLVGVLFLFYLLIAAVFPRPVQACVEGLTERPATTFLLGLLAKLLIPVIITILAITGVGVLAIPFVAAAVFLGAIVGKIAILEWIGFRIGALSKGNALENPLLGLVIGTVIVSLLYMVPVFGLLLFMVLSVWGLGAAVSAAFRGFRRETPERAFASAAVPAYQTAPVAPASAYYSTPQYAPAAPGEPFSSGEGPCSTSSAIGSEPSAATTGLPPVVPETLAFPRAGFWERLGAGFLDFVLLGIIGHFVGGPPLALLVAVAYFAGMWAWKGTTIGGIVLGLKVLRQNGETVTFAAAIVRALAGAFSVIVLFLGIFWIAWDREKQGWHDKIAGTVVLRLPRGTPLVCL